MKIVAKKKTPEVSVVVEKGVMIATVSLRLPDGYEHVLIGEPKKGDKILRDRRRDQISHDAIWEPLRMSGFQIVPEDRIIRKKRQGVVKVRRD